MTPAKRRRSCTGELGEGHEADGERVVVRELEDEPAQRDPLHPRARLRDELPVKNRR